MENVFNPFPELETERIKLKKLTYEDAADIHHYASQRIVSDNVTWDAHKSIEETLQLLILPKVDMRTIK
ncbi:hypothetical protein [Piscibacillus salipiscarius]|uniref:hypothetical protein n=1 Tax=Piscibacillus salipiscarius TaxID=299480 RepID=UPI002436FDAC|nr:hypothetical protein [Piscibacillus salipiscarius]